jgi:hypothetical protein
VILRARFLNEIKKEKYCFEENETKKMKPLLGKTWKVVERGWTFDSKPKQLVFVGDKSNCNCITDLRKVS